MRLERRRSCRPPARCPCAPRAARARAPRSSRRPSMCCTRTTMRSLRSRSSRISTKPASVTLEAGYCKHRMRDAHASSASRWQSRRRWRQSRARAESRSARRRASDRDRDAGERQGHRRPPGRLAVGGEIDDDAEAKGDRQPGHQPPRRDLGQRPLRQQVAASRRRGRQAGPGSAMPARRRAASIPTPKLSARARRCLVSSHDAAPPTLTQPGLTITQL